MRMFVTASLLTAVVLTSTFLDTTPSEGQFVQGRRATQPRAVYRSPVIRRAAPQRFQHRVQQTQRPRSISGTGYRERPSPRLSASRPLKRHADDVKGAHIQRLQAEQARRAALRSAMQNRAHDAKGANTQRLQAEQARRAALRSAMQNRAHDAKGTNANAQVPIGRNTSALVGGRSPVNPRTPPGQSALVGGQSPGNPRTSGSTGNWGGGGQTANLPRYTGPTVVRVPEKPIPTISRSPEGRAWTHFRYFVQRPWRRNYIWVGIPSIGYVTVPEVFYSRFVSYVDTVNPDYETAAGMLALAAVQEQEEDRVRYPMPPGASYRYTATRPLPSPPAQRTKPACTNCATPGEQKLPILLAMGGDATHVGILPVPVNLRPRITVLKPPGSAVRARLAAFVQRSWRGSFIWVAITGVGYITVPESIFADFQDFVSAGKNPDFDGIIAALSKAAVEDEDEIRVREPMPLDATYRLKVSAPLPAQRESSSVCSFEPFIDRKWNRAFVWVLIADTGNVTVPEDAYDPFYTLVSAQPPNYPAACALLTEEAAKDTVIVADEPVAPPQKSASPEVCTFEPFIERKWNRSFVWILIPQTGNITVPEDDYDRFYALVSADPPNYAKACALLAMAAAADSVAVANIENEDRRKQ